MADEVYNLDEILDMGQSLADGDYVGRATSIEPRDSKKGDPMMVVTFEITEGEYAGLTKDKYYFLKQGTSKTGRKYCKGISDIRADANTLGVAAALPTSITSSELRKVFAKILVSKKLQLTVFHDAPKEGEARGFQGVKITGLVGGVSTKSDPLGDLLG
jgi:hypothetical protein